MVLSAVTGFTRCCLAGGVEIRWIAPGGGNWHDAANWDLGRVPGDLDSVIIDLPGEHTISFCGGDSLWSSLTVINGDITLDACGGGVLGRYDSDERYEKELLVGVGATRPTHVRVTDGAVFGAPKDPGQWALWEETVVLRNRDDWPVSLTLDASAELGFVAGVTVGETAELVVPGDVPISFGGSFAVLGGGRALVGGRMGQVPGYVLSGQEADIDIDGTLTIDAGRFAGCCVLGRGEVRLINGASVSAFNLSGVTLIVNDESRVFNNGEGFEFVSVDLSRASPGERVDLSGRNWTSSNENCSVRYGPGNLGDPPIGVISEAFYGWSLAGDIVFGSDDPLVPGFQEAVGLWAIDSLGRPKDPTRFLVTGQAAGSGRLRAVSVVDSDAGSQLVTVYLLGTGEDWCPADLDFNGRLNFFDIVRFLGAFAEHSPWANLNGDTRIGSDDVQVFLDLFAAGCR